MAGKSLGREACRMITECCRRCCGCSSSLLDAAAVVGMMAMVAAPIEIERMVVALRTATQVAGLNARIEGAGCFLLRPCWSEDPVEISRDLSTPHGHVESPALSGSRQTTIVPARMRSVVIDNNNNQVHSTAIMCDETRDNEAR